MQLKNDKMKEEKMDNKYKVLVVDDSKIGRMTLTKAIEELGHEVIDQAVDGLDGCKKFQECKPDLVFTDIEMPNLNGSDMIIRIKKLNPDAKLIAVSSVDNSQIVQSAISSGAIDFIKKPITKSKLENAFSKIC